MLHRRTTLRSAKRRQASKKKLIFYSTALVVVAVALATAVSFILRIPSLAIRNVNVEGATVVPIAKVIARVEHVLDTKFLHIFPQKNILTYPKDMIEKTIVREFDRVLSADVEMKSGSALVVRIVDKKPFALWCGSVKVIAATDCYFVDERGTIFASAPYFSGTAFIKYYGVIPAEKPVGAELLDPERFGSLGKFVLSLRNLGLEPQDVVLGPASHEVYFRGGGKILFTGEDPYTKLFDNLESVLASAFKNTASSSRKFEYIDLRFDNRVFYKE
jgi:hypothetical protein